MKPHENAGRFKKNQWRKIWSTFIKQSHWTDGASDTRQQAKGSVRMITKPKSTHIRTMWCHLNAEFQLIRNADKVDVITIELWNSQHSEPSSSLKWQEKERRNDSKITKQCRFSELLFFRLFLHLPAVLSSTTNTGKLTVGKKKVFFVHLYLRLQIKFRLHWLDVLTWDLEDRTRRNHRLAGRAAFSSLTEHMSLDPQQLSHIQCAALGCLVIAVAARLCILMSRHNSLAVALSWLSVPWATATKMFWNSGVLQNIPEDGRGDNYPNWPVLQWSGSHFRRLSCRALSDPCSVLLLLLFCCLFFFNSLWKQLVFTVLWLTKPAGTETYIKIPSS